MKFVIFFALLMGILTIGQIVHETVHLYQTWGGVESVCFVGYQPDTQATGWVNAKGVIRGSLGFESTFAAEAIAYIVQIIVMLAFFWVWGNEMKKRSE